MTVTALTYDTGLITQHTVPGPLAPSGQVYDAKIVLFVRSLTDAVKTEPGMMIWNASTSRYDVHAKWNGTSYPSLATQWEDAVAAYITDDDIIRVGETSISWPDTQSKLNFCTYRFINESKDFKEDTVSWPEKAPTDPSDIVYATYLEEDNHIPLEFDQTLVGITSSYTAKAKAEYTVRSSRNTITYSFTVNRDYLFLEPGDIVKFQSDVLNLPADGLGEIGFDDKQRALFGDLILVREVKPENDGSLKITATRYDANVLAWNVEDNELSTPRTLLNNTLKQASNLQLEFEEKVFIAGSPGRLVWTDAPDARVISYEIKVAEHSIPTLATDWQTIGTAISGTTGFNLPAIKDNLYILTVVARSAGAVAPQRDWPILDIALSNTKKIELTNDPFAFVERLTPPGAFLQDSMKVVANVNGFLDPRFYWTIGGKTAVTNTYDSYEGGVYKGTTASPDANGLIYASVVEYAGITSSGYVDEDGIPLSPQPKPISGPAILVSAFSGDPRACVATVTEYYGPPPVYPATRATEQDSIDLVSLKEGSSVYQLLFSNSSVNLTASASPDGEITIVPVSQLEKPITTKLYKGSELLENLFTTNASGVATLKPLAERLGKVHIVYSLVEQVSCTTTIDVITGNIKIISLEEVAGTVEVLATIYNKGVNNRDEPITTAGTVGSVRGLVTINALLPGSLVKLARITAIDGDMFVQKADSSYKDLSTITLKDTSIGYTVPKRVWSVEYTTEDLLHTDQDAAITAANIGLGANTLELFPFDPILGRRNFSLNIREDMAPIVLNGLSDEDKDRIQSAGTDTLAIYSVKENSSQFVLSLSDSHRMLISDWLGNVAPTDKTFDIDAKVRKANVVLADTLGIEYTLEGFVGFNNSSSINIETGAATLTIDDEAATKVGSCTFKATIPKAITGTAEDLVLIEGFRFTKTMSQTPEEGPLEVNVGAVGNAIAFIKNATTGVWGPTYLSPTAYVNRTEDEGVLSYEWSISPNTHAILSLATAKTCKIERGTLIGPLTVSVNVTYTPTNVNANIETAHDTVTIWALEEGSSAYNIGLTNQSQMVRCKSDGKPYAGWSVSSAVTAVRGTTTLINGPAAGSGSSDISYAVTSTQNCSASMSGTTVSITSIPDTNADYGYAEVTGTVRSRVSPYATMTTLTAQLRFYKSYSGESGAIVGIAEKGLVFKKDKDGKITPDSHTLSIVKVGLTNVSAFWVGGLEGTILGESKIVHKSDYTNATTNTYTVTITGQQGGVNLPAAIVDSITIPLIVDGSSSPTVSLSNDNVTFQAGATGAPTSYAGSSCTVEAWIGAQKLTYSATGGANTFKTSIAGDASVTPSVTTGETFSVASMGATANSGVIIVDVTLYNGAGTALPVVTKKATYTVARAGRASIVSTMFKASLDSPIERPIGASYLSPNGTDSNTWSDGIPANPQGLPIWMIKQTFYIDNVGNSLWSTPQKISEPSTSAKFQFSILATGPWQDTPFPEAEYMQTLKSTNNGVTWVVVGTPVKIKGEKGNSAPSVSLTVSPYAFVKGKDGSTTPGTAVFTANAVNLTPPLSYSWSGPSFTAGGGSLNNTATVDSSGLNATTRSKTVTCTVTGAGPVSASDTESVIYLIDGDDAIIGYLLNGNQTVTFDKDGNPTVNTLSATYTLYKGADALVLAPGAYSISPSGINTGYTATMSSGAVTISSITSSFPAGGVVFTVSAVYNGKTYSDKLTVSRVNDGAPLVAIDLDNDSATVSTDFQGNGGVLGGAAFTSNADIIRGGVVNNTGWTFTWSSGTLTPASASGRTYACTGISVDSGSATVTATHATYGTRSAVFNVSKVKTGNPGTQYWIVPSHKVVSKNAAGIFTPSGNVTFTAMKKVGTAAPETATEATLTPASAAASSAPITCSMKVGGIEVDTETIPLVVDGAPGTNGAPGKATYTATVYLQNATYGVGNPPQTPSNSGSYNFYTGNLIAPSGWSVTQPDITTVPTWACDYTFTGTAPFSVITEPTVANGSWTNPRMDAIKSLDGRNTIVCEIYATGTRTTYPALPGTCTYNFQDHSCTGLGAYWGLSMPANPGTAVIWMSSVVFSSRENTATAGSWSNPVIVGNFISDEQQQGRTIDTFLYLVTPRADAPGQQPTIISPIDFDIGAFNWSSPDPWSYNYNFVAPSSTATAANSYWACRVYIKETYYKSTLTNANAFTATVSGPFRHINNEGLVTFTNMATARNKDGYYDTTMIDGGAITTDTIRVNSITSGSAAVKANLFFGFGITSAVGGWLGGVIGESYRADAIGGAFYSSANNGVGGIGINGGVFNTYPLLNKACGVSTQSYSIDAQATIYAPQGVTPFTGRHEVCVENSAYEIGDILVDKTCLQRIDVSNTIFICEISTLNNQKNAIGIYSGDSETLPTSLYYRESDHFSKRLIIPCFEHLLNTHKGAFVNALGEGQINICGEGGDLEAGDLVVTSSIPGKGMKQADDIVRSYTVARVREAVTFVSPTEVKMVSCIYMCG